MKLCPRPPRAEPPEDDDDDPKRLPLEEAVLAYLDTHPGTEQAAVCLDHVFSRSHFNLKSQPCREIQNHYLISLSS